MYSYFYLYKSYSNYLKLITKNTK